MVKLKKKDQHIKRHQTWVAWHKFIKRCPLILKFYNFSTLINFQFNFDINFFLLFLIPGWEREEKEVVRFQWKVEKSIFNVDLSHQNRWYLYQIVSFDKKKVHIRCFLPLKFILKKTNLSLGWLFIFSWFGFLRQFFDAIYRFIMVPIMFYKCFKSKMSWKISFG